MAENRPKFPTPIDLVGKNVYLRTATHKDVANTHHWFLQSDPALQSSRPYPIRTAVEESELYQKREASPHRQLYMIVRKKDNVPVGQIRYFHLNMLNRSAELGLIIDPDERRHGYALEAIHLLMAYLIKTRDINKVHAQTSSLNKAAVALLAKAGFKRDGTLRHHYYYDGELHDGYVYSLLRFEFEP